MSRTSPHDRGAKKVPQLSIKEKRAAKQSKRQPDTFIKPRKDARH